MKNCKGILKVIPLICGAVFMTMGCKSSHVGETWRKGIITDEFVFEEAPFPSCHAATIAETPKGIVVGFFGGTKERNPDVGIWLSRKFNGEWTAPEEVANGVINDTLRYPTWNPVLYQIPNGDLMLFYKVGPKPSEWWGMLMTSSDNGLTWSDPQKLPEGYIGPVKDKPVLLKNGGLVCPSSTEGNGWNLHMEITPDFGKTWAKTKPIQRGEKDIDAIQPSLLNHGNGKLQILCRTKSRAVGTSWSYDYGKTWSPLELIDLPQNNSGIDGVTLDDGSFLLVYNHVLPEGDKYKGKRTPLNVSVSDDGVNWKASLILEDSPISQYSYPSVIQTSDGLVHIVYTWRRERIKHVVLDPDKLDSYPIKNGQWPGEKSSKDE